MGQSSDELRQEIDQHRHDAERKISDLQQGIQGTAQDLRSQVQHTAEDLRTQAETTVFDLSEQVQGAVESTVHTLSESVDIEGFIKERPLVSLGAALIGGFILGGVIDGGDSGHSSRASGYTGDRGSLSQGGSSGGGSSLGSSLRNAIKSSGFEDTFNNAAAAMLGSVTEQLKQTMDRNMPGFAEKMDTAKHQPGTVMDKTREVQP